MIFEDRVEGRGSCWRLLRKPGTQLLFERGQDPSPGPLPEFEERKKKRVAEQHGKRPKGAASASAPRDHSHMQPARGGVSPFPPPFPSIGTGDGANSKAVAARLSQLRPRTAPVSRATGDAHRPMWLARSGMLGGTKGKEQKGLGSSNANVRTLVALPGKVNIPRVNSAPWQSWNGHMVRMQYIYPKHEDDPGCAEYKQQKGINLLRGR